MLIEAKESKEIGKVEEKQLPKAKSDKNINKKEEFIEKLKKTLNDQEDRKRKNMVDQIQRRSKPNASYDMANFCAPFDLINAQKFY